MQSIDGRSIYAASDLNDYLHCKRLTELDALVARGVLAKPEERDERAELIARKGDEHERRFLDGLRQRHGAGGIVEFERPTSSLDAFARAEQRTLEAMRSGAPVLYQATFFDGRFIGHADFLCRVNTPSRLGAWRYEVLDTKLAITPRPYFLVQLCNYSEHLERLQGCMPERGSIVLGDGTQEDYRLDDYFAYYRHLKETFLAYVQDPQRAHAERPTQFPFKVAHCSVCAWDDACTHKRRDDDHLSLVAWMRRDQIGRFEAAGIATVAALARATDAQRPHGMSEDTFTKLRRQADLQVRGRDGGEPIYELLHHAPPMGFAQLPAPAAGDVFFDMEGDPLYELGTGLEYLFGCWLPGDDPPFRAFWGRDRDEEKRTFEAFIDFVVARRGQHPALHVYHYASYEKTALRKLAQRHCTREEELDVLLRAEVFVDLYAIVRQALAISEESYGLKSVEKLYGQIRGTDVKKGDESIVMFEKWLQSGDAAILADIEAYNADDCASTYRLREWLLERRNEAIQTLGLDLPLRPAKPPGAPCHEEFLANCKDCAKRQSEERERHRATALESSLLDGILPPKNDDDYRAMPEHRRLRYLLGHLLAYHRRDEKPEYWAYFDRRENVDRLQEFDREAIGGLRLCEDVAPEKVKKSWAYTYSFPEQTYKLAEGDTPHDPLNDPFKIAGTLLTIDHDLNRLTLKRTGSIEEARKIAALIPRSPLTTATQRRALQRIAEAFVAGTLPANRPAVFDVLAARDPRLNGVLPGARIQPARVCAQSVSAVVQALDRSYIFIQGPPGSGKTTTAAATICDLLQRGKRVAVTSTGHKAIHNLLHKVEAGMAQRHLTFAGMHKHSKLNATSVYQSSLEHPLIGSDDYAEASQAASYDLAGGTAWLFAHEALDDAFDYLFIDEAGQVSLADALAMAGCAKNVVLIGDPSQLAHVSQGVHPPHAGDSVLQHLLGEHRTVPEHRGIFLDRSYRMEPAICAFISDTMYGGRLEPDPQTSAHCVTVAGKRLAGLCYVPVEHAGNASESPEEAAALVGEIQRLLTGTVTDSRPDRPAETQPLSGRDVVIVTPYNAQRRLIARRLRDAKIEGVEVGTVDKFQGREAAVVFYSMATSSGEDVPRDIEFLFERNRFNVAISRARALSVLACSPRLLDVACRTPEQMALANILCAFVQRAWPL